MTGAWISAGIMILAGILAIVMRVSRRPRPGLPPPDRATARDCFRADTH